MAATISITGHISQTPTLEAVGNDAEHTICRLHIGYTINRGRNTSNFIEITTWGDAARNHAKYLEVGSPVRVDGELAFETWVNDGDKRSRHTVINASVEYLGAPRTGAAEQAATPATAGTEPF